MVTMNFYRQEIFSNDAAIIDEFTLDVPEDVAKSDYDEIVYYALNAMDDWKITKSEVVNSDMTADDLRYSGEFYTVDVEVGLN